MAANRIGDTGGGLRISRNVSVERQTPKSEFANRLKVGVEAAAGALAAVAPYVPGGPIVSAAVSAIATLSQLASGPATSQSGVPGMGGPINTTLGAAGPNLSNALSGAGVSAGSSSTINQSLAGMQADNLKMMEVQIAMQRENTVFSTLSNILKVRHDTQKNSIGNIR